ncbi:hypothetical protein GJW-30_1_00940 [Variibacter gotjawalensis]|uniref:DUF1508 domain-containing protein n=1 Tax=Variibacter gotjawalensis TaxID=1333996 RepID=A0A0S3PR51_9BRAD|nr:hypothetical protein [Variibacter gotjawalensis]RZS50581.1 uncharacterized protein YegP (UPF0339 family) [Variibacter gotjawalensis]BAT58415.1 hypothetical protein GJW-30_1_00940 [Variibacter gotjawalensis]
MKFQVFQGSDGKYYWRARGANGEPLCHSEAYNQKASALHTINLIKREASTAPIEDLSVAKSTGTYGR